METKTNRLRRNQAALAVIDIQEKLLPAIHDQERVVQNSVRLIRGCGAFHIPVVVTEQYRQGLGPTVAEIAEAIPQFAPLEKLAFSGCGAAGFGEALTTSGCADLVLCGIEAHVCVTQTCLDLLDQGYRVFVAADATSSRTPENHRAGLDRMRDAGAILVSTEMILFEMLERAGTDEFKTILKLVK